MIRELSRVISKDVHKSAREAWKLWAPKIISLSSKTSSVKEVKELVKEMEDMKDEDDSDAGIVLNLLLINFRLTMYSL